MDAAPLLVRVAKLLQRHRLDAVLIGNAGAALHFFFRKTPANLKKLKAVTIALDAFILRSYYPIASGLYRIVRDEDGLQLDFVTVIDGTQSFEDIRKRAKTVHVADTEVIVRSEIIKSRKATGMPCWMFSKKPSMKNRVSRKAKLEALKKETDLALRDQIRRLMALPPERRCNFLRKRITFRISCL
jgi:hypothetical protein